MGERTGDVEVHLKGVGGAGGLVVVGGVEVCGGGHFARRF